MNLPILPPPPPSEQPFDRPAGDIQGAVVNLVRRLSQAVPVRQQPGVSRRIAEAIARRPSSMFASMLLRQSIIRGAAAKPVDVVEGLTSWITLLFDLDNMQRDRDRAVDVEMALPSEAVARLARAVERSRKGCILAVPHLGSTELMAAHLTDRGFDIAFVFTIGNPPTPLEQWLLRGRVATGGKPIAFGRRDTGPEIARTLNDGGVVCMIVDVYPSARFRGTPVQLYGDTFHLPPGPARYASKGTTILPGYAARREAAVFSMNILDPVAYPQLPDAEAPRAFTQALATQIAHFTIGQPHAYWLWHPIPNDPYRAIAERRYPDLLRTIDALPRDDEAAAAAVEELADRDIALAPSEGSR